VSVKQRLYPDEQQAQVLREHCGQSRFVYNWGLARRKELTAEERKRGAKINCTTQCKDLANLRKELDWLGAGSSDVQQGALRDLDRAFKNFFAGKARFPVFKKKFVRDGFAIKYLKVRRLNKRNAEVLIPKLGYVRFRLSVKWSELDQATSARVTYRNNRWFVSFTTPPRPKKASGQGAVGVDRGVAVTVMTSDGQAFHAPKSKKQQVRYENLQRRLATKAKGSANRRRVLDKMADVRFRIQNQRKDWVEKTTTPLAEQYSVVVLEDLDVLNMTKRVPAKQDEHGAYIPNGRAAKRGLNRSILGSLWGSLRIRLADKTNVVLCSPAFTSQRCSHCGHTAKENRQSQAVFLCVQCGHSENADLNAAKNILESGVSLLNQRPREDIALSLNEGLRPSGQGLPLTV
jgi:putative transposase